MSVPILMAAGLCLELLFVVLPLHHLASWADPQPTPWAYAAGAVPILAVMLSLAITRPGWTLGVVPLSHLPLLLIEPRISGPLVHVGLAGLATWSLTVIAATAWCVVALQCARAERVVGQSTSPPAPVSWIHWGPPVAALVIWGAFLVPIMSAPASPDSSGSVTAALMGLLVSMWVGFRWFGVELTDVQRDPRERARLRTQLLLRRRFSPQVFWTAASLSLVLGIVAALVYGAT